MARRALAIAVGLLFVVPAGTASAAPPASCGLGAPEFSATGQFAAFNQYSYSAVQNAPTFTQSWDQALAADVSQSMLTNLSQVFLGSMTPEQFGQAMDAASK